jgi:hypothetical protein
VSERAVCGWQLRRAARIDSKVRVSPQVVAQQSMGAKALAAAGRHAEAIRYAEDSKGLNAPLTAIAAFCEGVLLDAGFSDEAYARYAAEATYATTNLAAFKAIVKKYPHMPRETILRDLVASQPGNANLVVSLSSNSQIS